MKIYTKTGDSGSTGLFAGPRVSKDHPRINAYGTVDELNALLGVIAAEVDHDVGAGSSLIGLMREIQCDLFAIGAELATPEPDKSGMRLLDEDRTAALEQWIDLAESGLKPLENFILPGGTRGAALLQWARTVCRRAERECVHLSLQADVQDCSRVVIYLNRLSDLLFVLARQHNMRNQVSDVPWTPPGKATPPRKATGRTH